MITKGKAITFYRKLLEDVKSFENNLQTYLERLEDSENSSDILPPETTVGVVGYETDASLMLFELMLKEVSEPVRMMAEGGEYHPFYENGNKELRNVIVMKSKVVHSHPKF